MPAGKLENSDPLRLRVVRAAQHRQYPTHGGRRRGEEEEEGAGKKEGSWTGLAGREGGGDDEQ